ncbi:MAG: transcriptional regulator GcvA [Alphaproteobacteria bacterium]|jgi:LysR family glycine cleavage system transcriptional activator|nr:transcriptional regulator GcvA [Alphaproteobacteria bacterium]
MATLLPPLKSLPVFEAAARHLSFTKAAGELNVTQAAVSHQIKGLEDWLGIDLFRRYNRRLALTEAGQAYLPSVRDSLDALARATENLRGTEETGALTVSVLTSFAATWLMPRLRYFRASHPEIDVRIDAEDGLADFAAGDVDLAIRYGHGDYPGMRVDRLMTEDIFPVCSPRLLEGPHPLRRPEDLRHHTLLHDTKRDDWQRWLMAAGFEDYYSSHGPAFNFANMVLDAAIAGDGVALGRSAIAEEALADGRLVKPFDVSLPAEFAYYIVTPEATADRPKIVAFREWFLEEGAAYVD